MDNNERAVMDEIDKFMDNFIDRVFEHSQNNIIADGKVDTGTLLKTGNVNREYLRKEIVYPAEYAWYVHNGRQPGSMPPVEPIKEWVKRKLNVKNDKEATSIAWAICKAIEQRGIQPFPFLLNAANQTAAEMRVSLT